MRLFLRILWWVVFIIGALIVQHYIPGVDALVPGFLLSLQERKPGQTIWLFLLFTLIQEGTGSLTFGSSILWYTGQIILFRLAERLFVADNLLFIFMLSASLGVFHGALIWFMCAIQEINLEYSLLLEESFLQAAIIPLIWVLVYRVRPARRKVVAHGN